MEHEIEILPDADAAARRAAAFVAGFAREATAGGRRFTFAVSGGKTPAAMFGYLRDADMPWENTTIFQVDERIAPEGHPDRNLTGLLELLGHMHAKIVAMPVDLDDLRAAATRYADWLPERIDLVHLGLGDDGHTASLVPGDPVLDIDDRTVALTEEYKGRRRMTLTYPGIATARQLLWLAAGADKAEPLRKLLASDPSIPAGRVVAESSTIFTDRAAAGP
jgi:6-phosphogluconolactonase